MLFSNKDIKKLVIPLMVEYFLNMAVGMIDTIMVSSVGEAAVSGVSLVDMINQLILQVFTALATGGAVISAQYIGKKEKRKACESSNQVVMVTVSLAVLVMIFCLIVRGGLLHLLFGNIDSDVMHSAVTYFAISALSYPFIAAYNSGAAIFRSMNLAHIPMKAGILMNIVNIIGNSIFIYGCNMGAAGAAMGSLIARATSGILICVLLSSQKRQIHFIKPEGKLLQWNLIKKILYIGIPNGLENGMFNLGKILVTSIIAGFGTSQIAASAVANNIDYIAIMPGWAIGLAMVTIVGQCVGARDYDQVRYYMKKMLKISYITLIVFNIVIILALPLILKCYQLSDETLHMATILFLIHAAGTFFIWPLSFVIPNALRAANDVKFTMYVAIASMWIFRCIFAYILGTMIGWGAIGVWIAMILDWLCRSILFVWRFKSGKWTKVQLI